MRRHLGVIGTHTRYIVAWMLSTTGVMFPHIVLKSITVMFFLDLASCVSDRKIIQPHLALMWGIVGYIITIVRSG